MHLPRSHGPGLSGRHALVPIASAAVLIGAWAASAGAQPVTPERIAINDNRTVAGTLAGGTLTVHLEAREGDWHPDADTDPGIKVFAFAVEGGPLLIPGPLIRVTEGTEVRAFVRNRLEKQPLVLHGMSPRTKGASNATDAITIAAGDERELRFVAGAPGTYYYWAGDLLVSMPVRVR